MCGVGIVQDGVGLGVDIQKKFLLDWKKFCPMLAPNEILRLQETPEDLQKEWFTSLWVCKESYLKAFGVGLSISPSKIAIDLHINPHITKAMVTQSPFRSEAVIKASKVMPYYYAVAHPIGAENTEVRLIDTPSEV